MEKPIVNPEAELAPRAGDVALTPDQLALLGVFKSLKKLPAFAKSPGSWAFRTFHRGEVICRQGEAGGTAFYMLTAADLVELAGQVSLVQNVLSRSPALAATSETPRRLATARLLLDKSPKPKSRKSWWPWNGRSPLADSAATRAPAMIANDGPTDIDYRTRQAAIYEGEVFGEMSCLTRQPRSATIVADTDCYALEILRSILDQMRKDAGYKEVTQKKYRERVLENHLRQLSIFRLLTDEQFRAVQQRVELVDYAPGTVIWDEGDASDSLLIVRSGIVQVVQSYPWRLAVSSIANWPKLFETLAAQRETDPALGKLWSLLPADAQSLAASDDLPDAAKQQIVQALNEAAKSDALLTAKEIKPILANPTFVRETATFAEKGAKAWTGLQIRRANRALYHVLLPDVIAPPEPVGVARVLRYLGRGDTLGEIGVALNRPRSATCMAYSHAESDRAATDVELVRVPAEVVREMKSLSPAVRTEIERIADELTTSDVTAPVAPLSDVAQSRRAEELGLLQGQKLMLIDLDRCTRCGDCVQACIETHDDGFSRLFLDGPRFGKFLIPSSCRQCRDPVCMIGCPVGSIQQGDRGEIVIRDWCIGCSLCANQCPYDSIQMQDTALIRSPALGWYWTTGDDAKDDWQQPSYRESNWHVGVTPFQWGIAMQQTALAANGRANHLPAAIRFRYRFELSAEDMSPTAAYEMLTTTPCEGLEVYLNGTRLELTQDAPQKKRNAYAAAVTSAMLRRGANVVAVSVKAPADFNAPVLDLRLDRLAEEREEFEEKMVTEQAVVCDQCSTLPGNRAACVYACPHDAAFRIDAWAGFPEC